MEVASFQSSKNTRNEKRKRNDASRISFVVASQTSKERASKGEEVARCEGG